MIIYAKIATKIPAAVATKASLIAGAITEKLTLLTVENFANDSKIPITVPNNPINGAVEEIIDNQEMPLLASLINDISQTFKNSFDIGVFPIQCPIFESGFIIASRATIELSSSFSTEILVDNSIYL